VSRAIVATRAMPTGEYAAVVVDGDASMPEWVGVIYWESFGDFLRDATGDDWSRATVSVAAETLAEALAELST
jgi:hypothetical protein